MKILVGCECSGIVRDAFIAKGHDAISCDIKPTERPGPHIQDDIFNVIYRVYFDMMICFPECRFLCGSGLHWNLSRPERKFQTDYAINFAKKLWRAPIEKKALENSVGILSRKENLGKPSQYIQPYQFGEDASKKTCLWLQNLPILIPTIRCPGRWVNGRERWSNQTDSGQNKLPPSDHRSADRARTYQGIANAMASQWSCIK